jgi:hypothetical protein
MYALRRDHGVVQNYGEGDRIEVTDGPYAYHRGIVVGPVEGVDDLVAVVLDLHGRRVPTMLRHNELGPDDDGDSGGVREPSGPNGPSSRQSASVARETPRRESR